MTALVSMGACEVLPGVFLANLFTTPHVTFQSDAGETIACTALTVHCDEQPICSGESEGFLYVYGGRGFVRLGRHAVERACATDLFFLRQRAKSSIGTGIAAVDKIEAMLLTVSPQKTLRRLSRVVKLKPRTEAVVDWMGPWMEKFRDTRHHVAREGVCVRSRNPKRDPPAENPLHYHERIAEVLFTGHSWIDVMVRTDEGLHILALGPGDLILFAPYVPHGEGSLVLNKTYSHLPYQGFAAKIGLGGTTVDRLDRVELKQPETLS